jgi:hypothetical protein
MRDLLGQINKEPPGSDQRRMLLYQAQQASQRASDSFEELRKVPPVYKPLDAMENFGSVAVLLSAVAGLFAKRPFTASLAAAGVAMQAHQQQNWDQFKVASDQWKTQADMGIQQARLAHDQIREVMEDERLADNERQAKLRNVFSAMEFSQQQQNQWQNHYDRMSIATQTALDRAEREKNRVAEFNQRLTDAAPARAAAKQEEIFNKIETARALPDDDPTKEKKLKAAQQEQQDWAATHGRGASAGQGRWSDDAMAALVQQGLRGDPSVMTALPRSGPARQQYEEALAAALKDNPGGLLGGTTQMMMNRLRMVEAKAAASTAGRITMNTALYAQEAQGAGKLVIDASQAFPRTEIPKFNQALQAFEKGSGDPRIISFGTAINALVNAYGKMTNPTGTGIHDADKESLRQIIDTSLSQGQIEAGVAQIIKEGVNVSTAAQQAQVEVMSGLVPGGPGPQAAPPPAGGAGGASTPTPGSYQDGYIFKGGNPADPNSWTKAPEGAVQVR